MTNKEVIVNGLNIGYRDINQEMFISLTDIARKKNHIAPADVVLPM